MLFLFSSKTFLGIKIVPVMSNTECIGGKCVTSCYTCVRVFWESFSSHIGKQKNIQISTG